MPRVDVKLSQELFDSIPKLGRDAFAEVWKQEVAQQLNMKKEDVEVIWSPFPEALNADPICLDVHFSVPTTISSLELEDKCSRIQSHLEQASKQNIFLPENTRVGVWSQPIFGGHYGSFTTNHSLVMKYGGH